MDVGTWGKNGLPFYVGGMKAESHEAQAAGASGEGGLKAICFALQLEVGKRAKNQKRKDM